MTLSAHGETEPPSDYRLLLPNGWFRVRIEPAKRERSVDALINREFEGNDNVPHLKRRLRDDLLAQAAAAYREGGIELYLSLQRAGGLTIPASLLITLLPFPGDKGPPSVHDLAADIPVDQNTSVSVVELDAGPAVRVQTLTGQPTRPAPQGMPGDADQALPSVTLAYQLHVPGTSSCLMLTFSTPLVQIADAMVALFDAIATSFTWMDRAESNA
ncbi:hypothetical protein ACGFZL_06335 [Streptomyces sp. NPDC048182]|uniref:hypothetical protein n=1 Tax=Streptomyces sp. NPDC048182 TaxID=3365507 RepID=UPI00372257FC